MAVLELFKRGLVRVQQDVIFGEIEIEHIEGADSYQLDESVLLELEELSGDEPDLEGFKLVSKCAPRRPADAIIVNSNAR